MKHTRRSGLALVLLVAALAPAMVFAWPSVPLPGNSRGESVSEDLSYNGLPMRASKFTTPLKLDEVVAFYAETWGKDGHVVTPMGNKTVVGRLESGHYITVELEPRGGGTAGTVGIMKIPRDATLPELGKGFYRPAGTEVVSDIVHRDTPGKTRTLVMKNRLSPYANLQLYGNRLGGDGWRGHVTGPCLPTSTQCLVNYERDGGGRMMMTLAREERQGTVIVVNVE